MAGGRQQLMKSIGLLAAPQLAPIHSHQLRSLHFRGFADSVHSLTALSLGAPLHENQPIRSIHSSSELPLKLIGFHFVLFSIGWVVWLGSLPLAEPLAVPPPITHQRKTSPTQPASLTPSFNQNQIKNELLIFFCFHSGLAHPPFLH